MPHRPALSVKLHPSTSADLATLITEKVEEWHIDMPLLSLHYKYSLHSLTFENILKACPM